MIIKSVPTEPTSEEPRFSTVYDWRAVEPRVRKFTKDVGLTKVVSRALGGKPQVGYVEGPPTLNGVPHIGHVRGRIMKDLWYRYSTLLVRRTSSSGPAGTARGSRSSSRPRRSSASPGTSGRTSSR